MTKVTHSTLEEAIQKAREIEAQKPDVITDFTKFMIVPEIYKVVGGFQVVVPESLTQSHSHVGELLGYYDGGRFTPREVVRAEIKRDEAIEARDVEAMANRSRRY